MRDITTRNIEKTHILLVALVGEDFPFTGESAGVNAISGYMLHHYKDTKVDTLDMQIEKVEDVVNSIRRTRPAILGISAKLKSFNQLTALCRMVDKQIPREQQPLIVLGNALPTYVSELILKHYFPDVLIGLGEGEVVIEDLYRYVHGQIRLSDVRNIVYLDKDNNIVHNKRALMRIDRFTLPNRRRTREFYDHGGIVYTEQSRGCPWGKCTICASNEVLGANTREKQWRPLPLNTVMQDLDRLQVMGIEVVRYTDEDFFGSGKEGIERAKAFAEEKLRRENTVSFDIMARVDSVYSEHDTEEEKAARLEVLTLLKKAGLIKITLGVESFSPSQLKRYTKGITVKEIHNAIKIIRDIKIPLGIGFIPCDPLGSLEEIEETLDGLMNEEALLESSVCFNELRVQEGTAYVRLARATEATTGIRILGDLDLNSLNYPIIRYIDARVDFYVRSLRNFYRERNIYKIIYLLRTYLHYSSYKQCTHNLAIQKNFSALFQSIRECDYQLSKAIIAELKASTIELSTEVKVKYIIQRVEEQIEKLMLPFLVDLKSLKTINYIQNSKQFGALITAIEEYINATHSTIELQFKDFHVAELWLKQEFQSLQNCYRRLKMGRRLAEEHLRVFTTVMNIILRNVPFADRIAIMSYGSAGGQFMVDGADTDFVILTNGNISDNDISILQETVKKNLEIFPWRATFKSWDAVMVNPMELRCARFVCGNKKVYDQYITENLQTLNLVDNDDILITTVARSTLYSAFISSDVFSHRLRRFLTEDEFPQLINYGDIKYYHGGLRDIHAILQASLLYLRGIGRFQINADFNILVENDVINVREMKALNDALDFFLTAKDIVLCGHNIFREENLEKLMEVWEQSREEITREYDGHTSNVTKILEKLENIVHKKYATHIGVKARCSCDPDELKNILDIESVELWMTIALRPDLSPPIRSYLKNKIKERQAVASHSMLDEIQEGIKWAEEVLQHEDATFTNLHKQPFDDVELQISQKIKAELTTLRLDRANDPATLRSFVHHTFFEVYKEHNIKDLRVFQNMFERSVRDYFYIRTTYSEKNQQIIHEACNQVVASGMFNHLKVAFIEIHLTNQCNQHCAWCTYEEANRKLHLRFEDIERIAALSPVEILICGGGEPTLYQDDDKNFDDVIGRLRELLPGAKLRLITNGTVIPCGNWQLNIDEVSISADEATREEYQIHKGIDYFDTVRKNIIQGYLEESPIQYVRVTKIYNANNIGDSIALCKNLWEEWKRLAREKTLTDTKRENFRFMIFPMANDASPDNPYENTILTLGQKNQWQLTLEQIKKENTEFWQFIQEHTNLSTQHLRNLVVPPAEKCWSVKNYILVGADRLIYPCFATCGKFRELNMGAIDQSHVELFQKREMLYSHPPERCSKGCRPSTTFYGAKSYSLLKKQHQLGIRDVE